MSEMEIFRQQSSARLFGETPVRAAFWQTRFYDYNVRTEKKRVEKLRYMHQNPVKRGLVSAPEDWRWSSYRSLERNVVKPPFVLFSS
jgi:REP element-mobilizing transposase RayT